MIKVREYVDKTDKSPYAVWHDRLDARAAAKVSTVLYRLEQGNFSNTKGVGGGIFEHKINFGPGYRIYFGKDGECIVIILCGGTKKRQQQDIERRRHTGKIIKPVNAKVSEALQWL